jgi:hypothetical protein
MLGTSLGTNELSGGGIWGNEFATVPEIETTEISRGKSGKPPGDSHRIMIMNGGGFYETIL